MTTLHHGVNPFFDGSNTLTMTHFVVGYQGHDIVSSSVSNMKSAECQTEQSLNNLMHHVVPLAVYEGLV